MGLPSYYPANARDVETGQRVHVTGEPFTVPMPGFAHLPEDHPGILRESAIYPDGKLRLVAAERIERDRG